MAAVSELVCCYFTQYFSRSCVFYDTMTSTPETWTYSEIISISSRVACVLRRVLKPHKERESTIVGVFSELSPTILSSIVGILSVPAVYCPIDLTHPTSIQWSHIISCKASAIIVHTSQLEMFLAIPELLQATPPVTFITILIHYGIVIVILCQPIQCVSSNVSVRCTALDRCTSCSDILASYQTTPTSTDGDMSCDCLFHSLLRPSSIAYVVFTSGSTGTPKKVCVPYSCISSNIVDLIKRFDISPDDRVFNAAPLTFDPSIVEICLSLFSGACLVVVPSQVKAAPSLLSSVLIERQKVTVLQLTPSLFYQLTNDAITNGLLGEFSSLRILAFGGESCPTKRTLMNWKHQKNQTRIFNLYGITEVSSWATCHEITLLSTSIGNDGDGWCRDLIPIGTCLKDTRIELRDRTETDRGIEGTLWIGGDDGRVCLVDNEATLSTTWRNSGDVAGVECGGDDSVYIIGRVDRQIKRKGRRINLDYIQQVISSQSLVSSCAVFSVPSPSSAHTDSMLVAMIVPTNKELFSLMDLLVCLVRCMSSSHVPDRFVCVDSIPFNAHGKCDFNSLRSMVQPLSNPVSTSTSHNSITVDKYYISNTLLNIIRTLLLASHTSINSTEVYKDELLLDKSLINLGATSFDIVCILNVLEHHINSTVMVGHQLNTVTEWFEPLYTKPLREVVDYIYNEIIRNTSGYTTVGTRKRVQSDIEDRRREKIMKMEFSDYLSNIITIRRGSITVNGRSIIPSLSVQSRPPTQCIVSLSHLWSVPTGKCVDSSPLIVRLPPTSNTGSTPSLMIFIGSHSGLLLAICLNTGDVKWKTQLPDRLESSPCLSLCGHYVGIGCYDGCMYIVSSSNGEIVWCFNSEGSCEPIKCSPVVDPITGLMWFGSHDKHVYCIDIYKKEMVHKVYLDGGSCFSSPAISSDLSSVYFCTLKGNVFSIDLVRSSINLNLVSGEQLWCYSCGVPVFSSPVVIPNGDIAFGCVDGCIHIVNPQGIEVQILSTGNAVFSSCLSIKTTTDSSTLYAGSHDSHMYCWELVNNNYQVKWKTKVNASIYSTACYTSIPDNSTSSIEDDDNGLINKVATVFSDDLVCVCTSRGTLYLMDSLTGSVIGSIGLPGEVFSSPAVFDRRIVVGCRDELVYCLQISNI